MADHNYTGVTAYLKDNEKTEPRLRVLADALYVLQKFIDPRVMMNDIDPKYRYIEEEGTFDVLIENAGMTSREDFYFPVGTPVEYQEAQLEHVVIKGEKLVRLYIPFVAKYHDDVQHVVKEAYGPLLYRSFGSDLVSIKSKSAIEYEKFEDAKEKVLLSAQRKVLI